MRVILTGLGVISIAACSPAPEQTEAAEHTEAPPVETARIPARFQGVWDYVEGTCAPESDLRLEISAEQITFYEAVGSVLSAKAESGSHVVVVLAIEGEGETSEEELLLTLSEEGDELTPQFYFDGKASEPLIRKRCPA